MLFQEPRKVEACVPNEEDGTPATTKSTSSTYNSAEAQDHYSPSLSPFMALDDQKLPHKSNRDGNGDGKNSKNLPPLPNSKVHAPKKDDNYNRSYHAFRSSSSREFRHPKHNNRQHLVFQVDDY